MRKDRHIIDGEIATGLVFGVVAKLIAALAEVLISGFEFLFGNISDFIRILILKDGSASITSSDTDFCGHTAGFGLVEKHGNSPFYDSILSVMMIDWQN